MIDTFIQWLARIGLHPGPDLAQAADAASRHASQALGQMDMPALLALAGALGWASGFRLYAVTFLVGAMGAAGWIVLPTGLQALQSPVVLGASGFMLLVEFFADKIPWLDSVWDSINSVIRIPGGALLAAMATSQTDTSPMPPAYTSPWMRATTGRRLPSSVRSMRGRPAASCRFCSRV